jgi:hypothetical protein
MNASCDRIGFARLAAVGLVPCMLLGAMSHAAVVGNWDFST